MCVGVYVSDECECGSSEKQVFQEPPMVDDKFRPFFGFVLLCTLAAGVRTIPVVR